MRTIYYLRGLPGSGKTTWAMETLKTYPGGIKRVNKDDLRGMLDGGKWSKANEKFVLELRDALVLNTLEAGHDVIVDDTGFAPQHLARMKELAKAVGNTKVEEVDFTHVPLADCIERDLARPKSVGERVIRRMHQQYLAKALPLETQKLPVAVICDIDGTLAVHVDRGPFEMEKLGTDKLNRVAARVLHSMYGSVTIFLVSGREDIHRAATQDWLFQEGVCYDSLLMRPTGDTRRDDIVKEELYMEYIYGKYDVRLVLDDRDRIVDMWRGLGLQCWQVNYGSF